MVPWTHENIVWRCWRILIIGAKSSQDPIDELSWMVLLYCTQLYIEFSWQINQIMEVYTKNLAPFWPELVSHWESITQWYHIPAYQAFIYMYDFAYVPVAGNMCLTFDIMTAKIPLGGRRFAHRWSSTPIFAWDRIFLSNIWYFLDTFSYIKTWALC